MCSPWKELVDHPLKNVLVLSVSFFLIFTGCLCSGNLLSSLHIEEGLGVASQSVLYGVFILGAITTPPLCMKTVGIKKTIVFSAALYSPYVAANFYPSWYTFIPSSSLMGLAAGPLWASTLSYLSVIAKRKATAKGNNEADETIFFFLGILYTFIGLSNVFGNLVSFFILRPEEGYKDLNVSREALELCGVNFCDWTAIKSGVIHQPPKEKVWLLTGVYCACVLFGSLLTLALLDNMDIKEVEVNAESLCQLVLSPLRRFKNVKHWFLMPITIYAGFQESILTGDFTKAYVACSWGIYHIGLSMLYYGVVICVASVLLSRLVKVIDTAYIFINAGIIQGVGIILLWFWTPDTPKYVLYIIPAMWGLVSIAWQSQIRAMYGALFPDAKGAAFAVHSALEALGFLIGFAISSHICTKSKLWILATLLALSIAGYIAAEISHRKSKAQVMVVAPKNMPTVANPEVNKCKCF